MSVPIYYIKKAFEVEKSNIELQIFQEKTNI